ISSASHCPLRRRVSKVCCVCARPPSESCTPPCRQLSACQAATRPGQHPPETETSQCSASPQPVWASSHQLRRSQFGVYNLRARLHSTGRGTQSAQHPPLAARRTSGRLSEFGESLSLRQRAPSQEPHHIAVSGAKLRLGGSVPGSASPGSWQHQDDGRLKD